MRANKDYFLHKIEELEAAIYPHKETPAPKAEAKPAPSAPSRATKEADFCRLGEYMSVLYKRSDDYKRLLDFLDSEQRNPDRNAKDWARYALSIYESGCMHSQNKPTTFVTWHKLFCDIVGCEYTPYKPTQLTLTPDTRSITAFFSR